MQDVKSKLSCSVSAVPLPVPYAVLQAATQNFSSSNLLGEGSFGLVYKAKLDYDVNAAVKRLSGAESKHSHKEFQVLARNSCTTLIFACPADSPAEKFPSPECKLYH